MESKEYFEKIMQDYNQNGKGRSLRKYCKDEAVDYNWLIEFRKTYPARSNDREKPASAGFIPLEVEESKPLLFTEGLGFLLPCYSLATHHSAQPARPSVLAQCGRRLCHLRTDSQPYSSFRMQQGHQGEC